MRGAGGWAWVKSGVPVDTDPTLIEQVARVLNLIRPAIQADGGDVELVEVTDEGAVHIRLHGACVGCPSSSMTLKMGLERNLREHVPGVTQVVAID